jgi:stage II sporulation protein D
VLITDSRGVQYSLAAEDMRAAVNTDAAFGSALPSSFCRINGDPNLDSVTFFDGHGFGHGVGMCQWCAEARAQAGQSAEQILLASYPEAKLIRAY